MSLNAFWCIVGYLAPPGLLLVVFLILYCTEKKSGGDTRFLKGKE